MSGITIRDVTKRFGPVTAVDRFSLDIEDRDFLTLLGPSGCGKTTTLRCLAGLEEPDEGEIYIGDTCIFAPSRGINVASGKRNLGLVFQNYALWPHMTVFGNVAFGLWKAKLPKQEVRRKADKIFNLLGLDGFQKRYPHELSGGQQQRVAVARMIVTEPHVFLFDEPLSNLDAKLRMTLRSELKRMHRMLGATTVYVTHDQLEAMTLSTHIVVMDEGVIQQIGTPSEVYHFPANLFVADFMGNPRANLIPAIVKEAGPPAVLTLKADPKATCSLPTEHPLVENQEVVLNVRPEDILFTTTKSEGAFPAEVHTTLPTGAECLTYGRLLAGDQEIVIKGPEEAHICLETNQEIWLRFKRGNIFEAASGKTLLSFGFDGRPMGAS